MKRISFLSTVLLAIVMLASCGTVGKTQANTSDFPKIKQRGKTAIVAHRGFWNCAAAGFSQNSIAALREAQKQEFWGSEFDVHITADDVLIVNHDDQIGGRKIGTSTYDSFAEDLLPNGEMIPTLDEYLTQGEKSKKTVLVLEFKIQINQEREALMVDKTMQMLKEHDLYDPKRVVFISFSKFITEKVAREAPEFVNQYLSGDWSVEELVSKGVNGFDYYYEDVDETLIEAAHAKGMSTNVWTVNGAADIQKFIDCKVDAITTNEPLLARELLDRKEFKN